MPDVSMHRVGDVALAVRTWEPARSSHVPVVLVPGTGETAQTWEEVAADLSGDRVVHAVDLRGHGRSTWPGTYSIDLMAADLAGLLPRLADARGLVDVVGHSLGGLVALRATVRAPDPVRRLVLEDVGIPRRRPVVALDRPPGELGFDWAVVEQVRPEIDEPDARWAEWVAAITVPIHTIGGGGLSTVPQEQLADLVATARLGSMSTIDAGHEVHVHEPAAFVAHVRRALHP